MPSVTLRSSVLRVGEFLVLFVILPIFLVLHKPHIPSIPLLWTVAAYSLAMLYRDPTYDRSELWNPRPLRAQLVPILLFFALGVALIGGLVYEFAPGLLFEFVRAHPLVWAAVMLLYPVLSVYPQGIIYRSFILHRYRAFCVESQQQKWALIFLSALAFACMHLLFRNWVAVALTFAGGILFARRHLEARSLFASSVEHALYGCFIFTIGLGQFFYARLV
jgi:hypothetical protein